MMMLLFIVLIWYLLKEDKVSSNGNENLAIQILNKKFINGEIDENEYALKKKLIND
ncbi:hypothetical protein [Clostridium sp. JNZ J1-5]|nr:hypothetical protein [Clostridium sp.]